MRANQDAFLAAYAISMSVARAAQAAGVGREAHYRWLAEDATYKPRFEEAHRSATDAAVGEAWRRAVEGVPRYKLHNGKPVQDPKNPKDFLIEREYSDRMLELIVTRNDKRFKDRSEVAHTGPNGGPILAAGAISDGLRADANRVLDNPECLEALMMIGAKLAEASPKPPAGDSDDDSTNPTESDGTVSA